MASFVRGGFRLVWAAVAAPLLLAAGLLMALWLLWPPDAPPPEPIITETKDRLPPEAMDALVQPAMNAARAGDMAEAEFLLERQIEAARLTMGEHSLREADLLTAFGIGLFTEGQEGVDARLQRAGLPYLRRAVTAMRAAVGPVHPEVALALHSLADAESLLAADNPPETADAALAEAHRIRIATLGRHDLESVATLAALGRIKGLPARVRGDAGRLAEARACLEQAIADTPRGPAAGTQSEPALRVQLARVMLANGQRAQGLAEVRRARAGLSALSERQQFDVIVQINALGDDFKLPQPAPIPPRR